MDIFSLFFGGPPSNEKHKHRCGFYMSDSKESGEPTRGCGHVFQHGDNKQNNKKAHTCPKCGEGPWFRKYFGRIKIGKGHSKKGYSRLAQD